MCWLASACSRTRTSTTVAMPSRSAPSSGRWLVSVMQSASSSPTASRLRNRLGSPSACSTSVRPAPGSTGPWTNSGSRCVQGFPHQVPGVAAVNFPLIAAPFVMIGEDSSMLLDPGPGNPSAVTALRLPQRVLAFACPPSTHVEVAVFHRGTPVRVAAISANGATVDQAVTPATPNVLHRLDLTGPEIIRVELDGGDGEAYLAENLVDKRMISVEKWKGLSTYYGGSSASR